MFRSHKIDLNIWILTWDLRYYILLLTLRMLLNFQELRILWGKRRILVTR